MINWFAEKTEVLPGRSKGHAHWVRTRPRSWIEAESAHQTRFGKYWTTGTGSIPEPGTVGIKYGSLRISEPPWQGVTAPPWRVGASAPRRWADAPAEIPPFVVTAYHVLLAPEPVRITESQSIRDHLAHIRERARESGAAFVDIPRTELSFAEYMRGCRYLENEDIERWRRHDTLDAFIDAPVDDERSSAKDGDHLMKSNSGFEIRQYVPVRPRHKPGRKPLGGRAMSSAERKRRQRLREKVAIITDSPSIAPSLEENAHANNTRDRSNVTPLDRGNENATHSKRNKRL